MPATAPIIKFNQNILDELEYIICDDYGPGEFQKVLQFHTIQKGTGTVGNPSNQQLANDMINAYPGGNAYPPLIISKNQVQDWLNSPDYNCKSHYVEIRLDEPGSSVSIRTIPTNAFAANYSLNLFQAFLSIYPDFTSIECKPGLCKYDTNNNVIERVAVLKLNVNGTSHFYDVSIPPAEL